MRKAVIAIFNDEELPDDKSGEGKKDIEAGEKPPAGMPSKFLVKLRKPQRQRAIARVAKIRKF